MNTRIKGNIGENFAAEFLAKNGYKIIRRNYYCRGGEIDIICEDNSHIVFAEVKTLLNLSGKIKRPAENVTKIKQKRMLFAAQTYIYNEKPEKCPRIDVIEIYIKYENGVYSLAKEPLHIKNAVIMRNDI